MRSFGLYPSMLATRLLYMDGLKLIAKSEEELQKQMQTVKTFSDDIHMGFGLEKCAKIAFKKGQLVVDVNREIQEFEQGRHTSTWGLRKVTAHNISK
jgi:hypothetical protein